MIPDEQLSLMEAIETGAGWIAAVVYPERSRGDAREEG